MVRRTPSPQSSIVDVLQKNQVLPYSLYGVISLSLDMPACESRWKIDFLKSV